MVTLDALHTQAGTARHLVQDKHAHYLMIVKANQPSLLEAATNDLAGPRHLAFYARDHWAIENREHQASKTLRRSMTLPPRCGSGPRACWAWRQQLGC